MFLEITRKWVGRGLAVICVGSPSVAPYSAVCFFYSLMLKIISQFSARLGSYFHPLRYVYV